MKVLRADIPQQPMGIVAVANDTNSCTYYSFTENTVKFLCELHVAYSGKTRDDKCGKHCDCEEHVSVVTVALAFSLTAYMTVV